MEMYLGVWAVILALIITFGLFFYFGAAFNPVTSTMPFLVLTVGKRYLSVYFPTTILER